MTKPETITLFQEALHDAGYDRGNVLTEYEYFDPTDTATPVHTISLAAFGGYPRDYTNARIGVVLTNEPGAAPANRNRALGAPLVLTVGNGRVHPWAIHFDGAEPAGEPFELRTTAREFKKQRDVWGPDALGRVKSARGFSTSVQTDIFDTGLAPALARKFQERLKEQLELSFSEIAAAYCDEHGRDAKVAPLFSFLFRFVTAKIFMDRRDARGWGNLDTPLEILEAAEKHTGLLDEPASDFRRKRILNAAWESVSRNLHFQNLSVPDLAFVAESAFISDKTRDEYGVHSTPAGLAEYIVERLPWEQVAVEERVVWEPFSGHGILLAKALERLGRDLPTDWTPRKRHDYFRKRLIGVETDPLSLEICRLVLTLSDYPNGNSWERLHLADVFEWNGWERTLGEATAILANPPYEAFSDEYRSEHVLTKTTPPAEMLHRIFANPPKLMGLILPQSFLTHPIYRDANRQIAQRYERVEIVELPRIFRYADNETIALMASGLRGAGGSVSISYSEVRKDGVEKFLEDFQVSESRTADVAVPIAKPAKPFSLRLSSADALFAPLRNLHKLGEVAEIRQGIHWVSRIGGKRTSEPRTDVASDIEKDGFALGAEKMRGNLSQFQLRTTRYLSLRDEHQDPSTRAHKRAWQKPKAVCNAGRFQADAPWRLASWADVTGIAFTKQFFAVWPKFGISESAIAALLASPIVNAFSFDRDMGRDNHISTLAELPIPKAELLSPNGLIHRHAVALQDLLAYSDIADAPKPELVREAVLRLDAAVLDAYGLDAQAQTRLMRMFSGWARPLPPPFQNLFTEYFPAHFEEEITVTELLAITFDWGKTSRRKTALIKKKIARIATPDELERLKRLKYLTEARGEFYEPLDRSWCPPT